MLHVGRRVHKSRFCKMSHIRIDLQSLIFLCLLIWANSTTIPSAPFSTRLTTLLNQCDFTHLYNKIRKAGGRPIYVGSQCVSVYKSAWMRLVVRFQLQWDAWNRLVLPVASCQCETFDKCAKHALLWWSAKMPANLSIIEETGGYRVATARTTVSWVRNAFKLLPMT